jgi:hypothetical protein
MKNKSITLKSIITCPECGHQKEEIMPTDACRFFYECENCKNVLKPKRATAVYIVLMALCRAHQFRKAKMVLVAIKSGIFKKGNSHLLLSKMGCQV